MIKSRVRNSNINNYISGHYHDTNRVVSDLLPIFGRGADREDTNARLFFRERVRINEIPRRALNFSGYRARARQSPARLRKSFGQTSGEDLAGAICH